MSNEGNLREIAAVFSIPPAQFGPRVLPDLPCFCRPETRAAGTHGPGCPWWARGEALEARGATDTRDRTTGAPGATQGEYDGSGAACRSDIAHGGSDAGQ